jgi:hypothetical protein
VPQGLKKETKITVTSLAVTKQITEWLLHEQSVNKNMKSIVYYRCQNIWNETLWLATRFPLADQELNCLVLAV